MMAIHTLEGAVVSSNFRAAIQRIALTGICLALAACGGSADARPPESVPIVLTQPADQSVGRATALSVAAAGTPDTGSTLIPSPDGQTVYDTVLKVNWLANANLAGMPEERARFRVANITPGGSMNYQTALNWVDALNGLNGVAPYLGHNNWTLPTTPTYPLTLDPSCSAKNLKGGGSFGYGCLHSDMGSLFYLASSLHLTDPDTAVPIPDNTVGPFRNFQPYLYWTDTPVPPPNHGNHTFSFNTGWAGSNVDKHYLYVLPMIPGNTFGTSFSGTGLQPSADGATVYDPIQDITWLADANLAKTRTFGAQCTNQDGRKCINRDGSMTHSTAKDKWIWGMNHYHVNGYLGRNNWQLPTDPGLVPCGGFGCKDTPLGELYYIQLGLSQIVPTPDGTPVVSTPNVTVGPFNNVQPYLYWSCSAPYTQPRCQNPPPATNLEWSFSFGNGFQGTDLVVNYLYVMVYFPETPAQAADTTPPVTTASVSGPSGLNGWYVGPSVVNFSATDNLSGVFKTEYSLDNGAIWTTGTGVSLGASAIYKILYRSTDFVGNVETPKSIIVKLDIKPPGTGVTTHIHTIRGVPVSLEVDLNASDNLSGVSKTEYSLDQGSTWKIGNVVFLCGGSRTMLFRSTDVAGNMEKNRSIFLTTPLCGGP